MTVTPDEIRLLNEEGRALTKAHVERVIALLSLQPEDHAIHNVEAYHDGMRCPIKLSDNLTVYVYCLPWSRGWSIFTTPQFKGVAVHHWRYADATWRNYQQPCYNPRDTNGPWHTSPEQIAAAFEYIVRRLQTRGRRRRAALRRKVGQ